MSFDELQPLAERNIPSISLAGNTPTERMLSAFQMARAEVLQLVPAGQKVDFEAAVYSSQQFAMQIDQRKSIIQSSLAANEDLPDGEGLAMDAAHTREYWLSKYALAAEGIGAYASDAAKQALYDGKIKQDVYDAAVEARTKAFVTIANAGKTGQLKPLIAGEAYVDSAVSASPQGAMMLRSGQIARPATGSIVTVGTRGTRIMVPKRTISANGLGEPITVAIIAGVVVVTLIGLACVAGTVYYLIEKKRMEESGRFMSKFCEDAMKAGDQKSLKACRDYASNLGAPRSLAKTLLGGDLQDYLLWGGVALAGIIVAPMVVRSVMDVQRATTKNGRR